MSNTCTLYSVEVHSCTHTHTHIYTQTNRAPTVFCSWCGGCVVLTDADGRLMDGGEAGSTSTKLSGIKPTLSLNRTCTMRGTSMMTTKINLTCTVYSTAVEHSSTLHTAWYIYRERWHKENGSQHKHMTVCARTLISRLSKLINQPSCVYRVTQQPTVAW